MSKFEGIPGKMERKFRDITERRRTVQLTITTVRREIRTHTQILKAPSIVELTSHKVTTTLEMAIRQGSIVLIKDVTVKECMARSFVVLFRGHKDRNYLKTHFLAPCFSEDRSLAILYGKGGNDESNSKLKDGYLTSLEFYGEIFPVADKVGLDLLNNEKRIEELKSKYDAVKCKDGVILVFDTTKLKMLTQELT